MQETIEYIKATCKERNIPISKLERDCGFGNGYFNPKKLKRIPYERAVVVAEYLSVPLEAIWRQAKKENPTTASGDEVKKSVSGYELLNEDNKAIIDRMIEKLIKAQSAE